MDNQQERFEFDLAWFAGIIEGEGWVSLIIRRSLKKSGKYNPAFIPVIGVVNTDDLIMDKIEYVLNILGVNYFTQKRKSFIGKDNISRKSRREITISSNKNVRILSTNIYPFMIGEKKSRLEKLTQFLDLRDSKPKSGINSGYGEHEFKIYNELYSFKGKSRSKILNDLTPNTINRDDKV
jgi:hypothetical protein